MTPARALAETLLQSVWQLAAIGLLADFVLVALHRRAAAQRHAAAMVSLVAILAIPSITFVACLRGGAGPLDGAWILVHMPPGASEALRAWAPAVWLPGACAMLVLHLRGLAWLRRLQANSTPLAPQWQARIDALRARMGVTRPVAGRIADVAGAFTARHFKPVIWLPAALLTRLPPEQVEALLAHELAHIRRLDWLCNALQCAAETLFFFHPSVWWLGRQLRRERELACDRLAVEAGVDPLVLAQALAQAARRQARAPRLALAAARGELTQRIAHLLTGERERQLWRAPALVALVLMASLCVGHVAETRPWERRQAPSIPAPPLPPVPPAPPPAP